VVVMCN